jgi:hypothetical protein
MEVGVFESGNLTRRDEYGSNASREICVNDTEEVRPNSQLGNHCGTCCRHAGAFSSRSPPARPPSPFGFPPGYPESNGR